jgi:hypothetical protein
VGIIKSGRLGGESLLSAHGTLRLISGRQALKRCIQAVARSLLAENAERGATRVQTHHTQVAAEHLGLKLKGDHFMCSLERETRREDTHVQLK